MAYDTLKAAIASAIKQNGNNEITGPVLQEALLSIINVLGANWEFGGYATTATDPGVVDSPIFYIANEIGTYTNFGGIEIHSSDVPLLMWDVNQNEWFKPLANPFVVNHYSSSVITGIKEIYISEDFSNTPISVFSVLKNDNGVWSVRLTLSSGGGYVARLDATGPERILKGAITISGQTADIYVVMDWDALQSGTTVGGYGNNHITKNCYDINCSPLINSYINALRINNIEGLLTGDIKTNIQPDVEMTGPYMSTSGEIISASYTYMGLYMYQVEFGKKYNVNNPAIDTALYYSAAFFAGTTQPQAGDVATAAIGLSNADVNVDYIAPADGWIVCRWRNGQAHGPIVTLIEPVMGFKTINGEEIVGGGNLIVGNGSQVGGKTIAVLGDSIMENMTQETMPDLSGVVTLRRFDGQGQTIYQESDATVINGIIWLTSSLVDGQPTANSVRLEIINSNQSVLDSMVWESLKTQLGANDVICLGFGGASIGEKEFGITTEYPLIRDLNEGSPVAFGNTVCLPNEVKMLKRLTDNNIRPVPDCCIIWMGVNGTNKNYTLDQIMQIPYSTLADDVLGFEYRCDFFGGLRYGVETLYRNYPYATIMIVSPVQTHYGDHEIDGTPDNYRGYCALDEICQDLRSFANRYSCIFVDALHEMGLVNFAYKADTQSGNAQIATGENLGNIIPLYTRDGLHPNADGRYLWRNFLAKRVESLYFKKKQ